MKYNDKYRHVSNEKWNNDINWKCLISVIIMKMCNNESNEEANQ